MSETTNSDSLIKIVHQLNIKTSRRLFRQKELSIIVNSFENISIAETQDLGLEPLDMLSLKHYS